MSERAKRTTSPAPGGANCDIRAMRAASIPSYMRVCYTTRGRVRLTTTEVQILSFIERNEGRACSKSQIAKAIGRNDRVVSRLISRLRQYGILETEPSYAENGAQLANVYRISRATGPYSEEAALQGCAREAG